MRAKFLLDPCVVMGLAALYSTQGWITCPEEWNDLKAQHLANTSPRVLRVLCSGRLVEDPEVTEFCIKMGRKGHCT